ncbi:MAG: AEC family transporter [Thermofilum sp.]|jgi:predicted permease|nr:AEC family transporter [Thermofilum sp.]
MLQELLNIYIPLLSGLLFSYFYRPREEETSLFAKVVLYVFLTPLLFTSTYTRLTETRDFSFLSLTLLSSILVVITFATARKLFKRNELVLASMYANAGYIPLGIAQGMWGSIGVASVGFYILGNSVASNVLSPIFLANNRKERPVRRLLEFPPFHAILLAILLASFKIQLPKVFMETISTLGNVASTVALVQLGVEVGSHLDFSLLNGLKTYLLRLLIAATVTWAFVSSGVIKGVDAKVALIESVMPSAVSCVVVSRELGLDSKMIAGIVFASTFISTFVFLPIALLFIQ